MRERYESKEKGTLGTVELGGMLRNKGMSGRISWIEEMLSCSDGGRAGGR